MVELVLLVLEEQTVGGSVVEVEPSPIMGIMEVVEHIMEAVMYLVDHMQVALLAI